MIPNIALLITGKSAFADFCIYAKTLKMWHRNANLYISTDTPTHSLFASHARDFEGLTLHIRVDLDAYAGLTRSDMEARPGTKYDSLFKDYTYEKANVIRRAFECSSTADGVWFHDTDIVHLAPLPSLPAGTKVALSPHYIRPVDERLYGKYNAGFFWFADPSYLDVWITAAPKSRFFEQAALEDVAAAAGPSLYEFPPQVNFGWWRMFQGTAPPTTHMAKCTFNRSDASVGIRYDGATLQSIHSHMDDVGSSANAYFNKWLNTFTAKFASHPPMRRFRRIVGFDAGK